MNLEKTVDIHKTGPLQRNFLLSVKLCEIDSKGCKIFRGKMSDRSGVVRKFIYSSMDSFMQQITSNVLAHVRSHADTGDRS